ncbi:MAG: hypothetical protein KDE29_04825, partial [Anaerolineales bacterium]|nr:hypothetical protein [Anaerolineales bacterium]
AGENMATLKSGNLSFDFRYTGFEHGWVQYQFYFLWKGEPMVRDESLKRWNDYWNCRPESAFLANEHGSDGLLPFLRGVLENNEADYWEPLEPDIVVALYPDDYFPFLKSHLTLVYESDESIQRREARKKLKEEKGKLPDDSFTFIAFVDAYNFKDASVYYGQGLSLHMIVNRHELEEFANQLEKEYSEFKLRFKADL